MLAFLVAEQWDVIRRVGLGETPSSEVRDGWVFIATYTVLIGLLVIRPRVTLRRDRSLIIQNPLRRWVVAADRVRDIRFGKWGLVFELDDGRRPWSIIFQDTSGGLEPRWFDVAEAVMGVRPQPVEDCAEIEL